MLYLCFYIYVQVKTCILYTFIHFGMPCLSTSMFANFVLAVCMLVGGDVSQKDVACECCRCCCYSSFNPCSFQPGSFASR